MQDRASGLGIKVNVAIYADVSAAFGIVQRRGIGRVRHVKTQSLWLQQAHAQRRNAFGKVDGSRNSADLLTKHTTDILLDNKLAYASCVAEDGRAASVPTHSSLGLNTLPLYGSDIDRRTATTTTSEDVTTTRNIGGKVLSAGSTTASGKARISSTSATTSGSVDGESVLMASDDRTAKISCSTTGERLAAIARHRNSGIESQHQTGSTLPRSFQTEITTTGNQESCSDVGMAGRSVGGPSRQGQTASSGRVHVSSGPTPPRSFPVGGAGGVGSELAGPLVSALKTSRGPVIPRASDACGHAIAGEESHRHNFGKPAEKLDIRWGDEATSDGEEAEEAFFVARCRQSPLDELQWTSD